MELTAVEAEHFLGLYAGRVKRPNPVAKRVAEGTTAANDVQYAFNDIGLLEKEYQEHAKAVDPDTTLKVQYVYDGNVDGNHVYTKGLRPKSVTYPNSRTVHSLYVDAGGGSGIGDAISRLTALASADSRGVDDANVHAAFYYNGAARLVIEDQKNAGNSVAALDYYQGVAGTYAGFDRFGRVVDQRWMYGVNVLDWYAYGYDRNSDRKYRENVLAMDRSEVYSYDSLSRLAAMNRGTLNTEKTAVTGLPAREELWNLSQTGNWMGYHTKTNGISILDQTRTNNKANEITGLVEPESQTQWVVPQYDARGNMITMPKPNSPASGMTCVYDAWNRMVTAKNSDGTIIATYRYDGTGRRIQRLLGADPENPTATYDFYHNPAWQILETRKNGSANPCEQFVWSPRYVHSPVLRWFDPDTDGANLETLYYTNDANFNVTALVDVSGAVVERYTYDPYGKVTFRAADWTERAASAYANDVLFTGHRLDVETGLYDAGFRYYHPTMGLWVQREDGYYDDINFYQYVMSGPISATDPSGLASAPSSGTPAAQASPGGKSASPCCCTDEPVECSIKIDIAWETSPVARWRQYVVTDMGARFAGSKQTLTKFSFEAVVKVTATLEHKDKKSVKGCHLAQDITARSNWIQAREDVQKSVQILSIGGRKYNPTHTMTNKEPYYEWTIEKDVNSGLNQLKDKKWREVYKNTTFTDYPKVNLPEGKVFMSNRHLYPDTWRYWLQAHVYVEEVAKDKLQNWWGFEVTIPNWKTQQSPTPSVTPPWKDEERQPPVWK